MEKALGLWISAEMLAWICLVSLQLNINPILDVYLSL